jgi:hypothetical protein
MNKFNEGIDFLGFSIRLLIGAKLIFTEKYPSLSRVCLEKFLEWKIYFV